MLVLCGAGRARARRAASSVLRSATGAARRSTAAAAAATRAASRSAWIDRAAAHLPRRLRLGRARLRRAAPPPADALPVYVVGKQWMWTLQHRNGRREIDELHVPLGQPVRLVMTSQDVIHSFFVPAFRLKQDVRARAATRRSGSPPTQLGEFRLFCAEYCGTRARGDDRPRRRHGRRPTFARWLDAGAERSRASRSTASRCSASTAAAAATTPGSTVHAPLARRPHRPHRAPAGRPQRRRRRELRARLDPAADQGRRRRLRAGDAVASPAS